MKDRDAYLEMMITEYEDATKVPLSMHDPTFHTFNAVAIVADILSVYSDMGDREKYIITAKRRNSVIAHAVGMGYTPVLLEPDRHIQRLYFSDEIPEPIKIYAGTKVRTEIEDDEYTVAEVVADVDVPEGSLYVDVEIEVGETVETLLGEGKDVEESFPLEGDYVYLNSLKLRVETEFGDEEWTMVENFLDSESYDNHFIVDIGAQDFSDMMKPNDLMLYIRCGDGQSGRVFPENTTIYAVYKEVNPYQETMPLGSFVEFEDPIEYVDRTENVEVTREKTLPEDIEVLRRNAIYTKAVGTTLDTKEDFERASILQSGNKIKKAYAEGFILDEVTTYRVYVSGYDYQALTPEFLVEVRDKMYANYARNITDVYEIVQAPILDETMQMTIIFKEDTLLEKKEEIKTAFKDIVYQEVSNLNTGQTYKVPILWNTLMEEVSTTYKEVDYVQINSQPPAVPSNTELRITPENISIEEM